MSKWIRNIIVVIAAIAFGACVNTKKQDNVKPEKVESISGDYVTEDYFHKDEGYDWVAVKVSELTDSLLFISIRSRADKKQATCTFDARATKQDSLGLYKAIVEGNSVLFLFAADSLVIKEDSKSGYSNLNYFCSGGGSIAGVYSRLSEPLDTAQIDKVLFRKSLNYNQYYFLVEVYNKNLTIQPVGLEIDNQTITHRIEGTVMNAEVGDLNMDGFPEVLVYIQSVGSGSYGSVVGYSVNNGKSMSQVYLPEVYENPKIKVGYMGHDEFAIVENTFVQRFPLYKPEDTNVNPTGGMRQIQYKLKDGEALRKFVIDKIIEY